MIRYFTAGNSEALLVTSLEAHNEILYTKCYSFEKPAFFIRLIRDIAGLGLPVAIGDTHRKQRKTLNGMFMIPRYAEAWLILAPQGCFPSRISRLIFPYSGVRRVIFAMPMTKLLERTTELWNVRFPPPD